MASCVPCQSGTITKCQSLKSKEPHRKRWGINDHDKKCSVALSHLPLPELPRRKQTSSLFPPPAHSSPPQAAGHSGLLRRGHQQRHNKTLHPTAYSPALVPRYGLPAAGELGRTAGVSLPQPNKGRRRSKQPHCCLASLQAFEQGLAQLLSRPDGHAGSDLEGRADLVDFRI